MLNRSVDIEFVRYSSNYILGTVRGSVAGDQPAGEGVEVESGEYYKKVYREFFKYLGSYPQLKEQLFKEYPELQTFKVD